MSAFLRRRANWLATVTLLVVLFTAGCGSSDDPSIDVPEGSSTSTTMDSDMPGMDH